MRHRPHEANFQLRAERISGVWKGLTSFLTTEDTEEHGDGLLLSSKPIREPELHRPISEEGEIVLCVLCALCG